LIASSTATFGNIPQILTVYQQVVVHISTFHRANVSFARLEATLLQVDALRALNTQILSSLAQVLTKTIALGLATQVTS